MVSLRDLNEWVSKQETELLELSPVGGDEATIRKQQVVIICYKSTNIAMKTV